MVHNRWEDFHVFARYVSEVFNSTDAYTKLPLEFGHGVLDTTGKWGEFKQWDLLHTRAISEWLQDSMLAEALQVRTFHILYVERLNEGLIELAEVLCMERGYCKPLPQFPQTNSFETAVPKEVTSKCWEDPMTVRMIYHRYLQDF